MQCKWGGGETAPKEGVVDMITFIIKVGMCVGFRVNRNFLNELEW